MTHRLARTILLAASALALAACINIPPGLFGGGRGPLRIERIQEADSVWTRDEILMIDATGMIAIQDATGGLLGGRETGMVVQIKDRLKEAAKNEHLKAVILRIDSPGGGVTASDILHHEILEFKKKKKVPVVAVMQDVAASGGLYIAMAADEIYAMPTTITGSIGVITILPDLQGLSDKIGLKMRVVKSGVNKDLGSPWRDLTDDERKIFQGMIDSMYSRFLDVIVASREKKGLTRDKLKTFADGRVLTGEQALQYDLIDGVAQLDEVIEKTKKLAKLADASVISYEYPFAYRGNIYALSPAPRPAASLGPGEVNLIKTDMGLPGFMPRDARLLYMWVP